MTDNLLQEVDAALRADRAADLWNKHKSSIIGVALAIVLATAANSAWQYYRELQGGKTLAALSEAKTQMLAGKNEDAAQAFAHVAASEHGEMKALALVWQARALSSAGKTDEAVKVLSEATATGANLWSDMACLRLAGLDAAAAKSCLEAKDDSPLKELRAEWAVANLWEQGDSATATKSLEAMIADKKTSPDTREQLTQWLAVMNGVKK